MQARKHASKGSNVALKSRADVTTSQNISVQKNPDVLHIIFKKEKWVFPV